jgi:hypothetical protein
LGSTEAWHTMMGAGGMAGYIAAYLKNTVEVLEDDTHSECTFLSGAFIKLLDGCG